MWTKLKNFFLDHINWCHEYYSTGEKKPVTKWYQFFCWTLWPIPWMEKPCWCCAATRGYIQGGLIGIILGYIIWGVIL